MDSSARRLDLASALGWRLLAVGALAAMLAHVLASTTYYASALVLAAALGLALFDIVRWVGAARAMPAIVRHPAPDHARQLDRTQALLDAVSAALFAISSDGVIHFANRAGRLLAGIDPARLEQIPDFGPETVATLLALPPGGRALVMLGDGRAMLARTLIFSAAGEEPQRLLSLQTVSDDLDIVQVGAWRAMTRVLAHEMMNSLTPIASLSESLKRLVAEPGGGARPEVVGAIDTIARRSDHLMRFVERYRAVTDLPEPQKSAVDLSAFLRDIATLIEPTMAAQGIAFSLMLPPEEMSIEADSGLLGQAIFNLLHNAIEALSDVRDPRIDLTSLHTREGVAIEVCDNGPGVPWDRMEDIFVPFFTTKPDGSGIGLALSRQIALLHGGRLLARPRTNEGMAFRISLPVQSIR
jgi:signal transduction histidine kinase